MSWAFVASRGTAGATAAGATLTVSPSATIAVGRILVVAVGAHSTGLTTGFSTVLSVSDDAGNTYTRLIEQSNNVGANDSLGGLFMAKVTTQLTTASVITFNTGNASSLGKGMSLAEFSVAAGQTFALADAVGASDVAAASLTATSNTLSSVERLWLGLGEVATQTGTLSLDSASGDYAAAAVQIGGNTGTHATSAHVRAGYRIATLTSDGYTSGTGASRALVVGIVAVDEVSAGGPQTFFQDVGGTLTSGGALSKLTSRVGLAGTLSTAGALLKQTSTLLTGTLASAGTLTAVKIALKALDGTLATAGVLLKQAQLLKAGTLTAAGALLKQVQAFKVGTLTSAGALSSTKTVLKSLDGTLPSAGTVSKQPSTSFAGTLTSASTLLKETRRALAGTLTSSGLVTMIKAALKSIDGTLTTSGTLVRQPRKVLASILISTGTLDKRSSHTLAGTLTASGVVTTVRTSLLALDGMLTSAGVLLKDVQVRHEGTLTLSGTLTRLTARALAGVLDFLSTLTGVIEGAFVPNTLHLESITMAQSHVAPGVALTRSTVADVALEP